MDALKSGLQFVSSVDVELIRRAADEAGFTTFVLPGTSIYDHTSFFDAVRATLPLDPSLVGSHSWDALSDSLWEGLHCHADRQIAILWPGAATLAVANPSTFEMAVEVLANVAQLLADPAATCDHPKEVAIIVEK